MVPPGLWPFALLAVLMGAANAGYQRCLEQQAAQEAGQAISGFVDFYYDYEVPLDDRSFPALEKQLPPLPDLVYRFVPHDFCHPIVAAAVTVPDDRVQELLPLAKLSQLRALSATWASYGDEEFVHLREFPRLEYLDLSVALRLSDQGLLELAQLKSLKVLKLSRAGSDFTEAGIANLRRNLPHCHIHLD